MSRILLVYERVMPTVELMKEQFGELFDNTQVKYVFKQVLTVIKQDLENTDTLILIRPYNYLSSKIAEEARKCGVYIVFFMDDDMFHLPSNKPCMPWRNKALWKNVKQSDMVLSGNQYIVDMYREYSVKRKGVVIHTTVSANEIKKIPIFEEKRNMIKIIYAAGSDHADLFETYIEPILSNLDKKYGQILSLTFVDVHPDIKIENYRMQINYKAKMPLQEYREYMRKEQFHIGLAPLHDNSFCKCKYFNKYIEYTLVGTVGIYSNCEPYTLVVEDGVNGKLADNTKENWYDCLETLIENDDMRNNCLSNAINQISSQFCAEEIRKKFILEAPEIFETRNLTTCRSLKIYRQIYRLFQMMDGAASVFFYLRQFGLLAVVKKIMKRLKGG